MTIRHTADPIQCQAFWVYWKITKLQSNCILRRIVILRFCYNNLFSFSQSVVQFFFETFVDENICLETLLCKSECEK